MAHTRYWYCSVIGWFRTTVTNNVFRGKPSLGTSVPTGPGWVFMGGVATVNRPELCIILSNALQTGQVSFPIYRSLSQLRTSREQVGSQSSNNIVISPPPQVR